MDIYLSYNNYEDELWLPVLPSEIEIVTGLNNTTLEVVGLGEIGVVGNRKLNTIAISSFFPKYYSSYCQQRDIPDPYIAVQKIEFWRDSKKPIRLHITDIPLSMPCMIEEFKYREKGGQPGDVYYDLSLKEYRFIVPRVVTQYASTGKMQVSTSVQRPIDKRMPNPYTVKQGDSLYIIAKMAYGDGSKYMEIYEKNKGTIGSDPKKIEPGQVLAL